MQSDDEVIVTMGRETSDRDFGENTLLPPDTIDLLPVSDSGDADDDNLTNRNNEDNDSVLQFLINGVQVGATVRVYSDGTLIGSATAAAGTAVRSPPMRASY